MRRRAMLAGLPGLALPAGRNVAAQQPAWFPSRPIRVIVPWPPAGTTDIVARMIAQPLTEALGQPVVVENRAGAAGLIGTEAIVRAEPDGHVFGFIISTHVANAHLVRQHPYDPVRDITPLIWVVNVSNILVVPRTSPVRSVQEFVEQGRRSPRPITFASSGTGTSTHFSGEMFRLGTSVPMQHVPYRGGGPALSALMSGEVTMAFLNLPTILPQAQSGTLRILGLAELRRSALEPDIPTMSEVGLPDFAVASWCAIFVPRRTPGPVIARFNAAIREAVADEDLRARFLALGVDPRVSSPEELDQIVARDFAFWGPVIRSANITL
jgi:tripartite-type tricarboxylate transporter receptor subunit TctC